MSIELTATERVKLLEQMQEADARQRRKTVVAAWMSVGIATLVLALLAFGSWWLLHDTRNKLSKVTHELEQKEVELQVIEKKKAVKEAELAQINQELTEKEARLAAATQTLSISAQAQGKEAFEKQLSADPKAAALLPRAYAQIVDAQDREWAKTMSRKLENAGIIVPGIELVPSAAGLKQSDVRFYKKSEQAGAEKIIALLKSAGVDARLNYLNQENNTKVRPNHFEIWFAAGSRNTQ